MPTLARFRGLSALEFFLGSSVVVLHNVYHLVPNEVPILFVAGWISVRVRNRGWRGIGLTRPSSWPLTVGIAAALAVVRLALGELVLLPILTNVWPPPQAPQGANLVHASVAGALIALLVIWTFAAFGEELSYRGYLLNRAAEAANRSRGSWVLALVLVSVLFGLGHYYKGPAGVVDSGVAGLLLGGGYLLSRRNLWVPILAHGLIDTIAVAAAYFGT